MRVRLFIALEFDRISREKILRAARDAGAKHVVPAENLHATLAFLGERESADDLIRAMGAISANAFDVRLGKSVSFGSAEAFLLSDNCETLALKRLTDAFTGLSAADFVPHVTVTRKGRLKKGFTASETLHATAVTLFKSEFTDSKRIYTPLKSVLLKPKKDFRAMLFDLDGTLTNSAPGIKRSLRYALDKLGVTGYDPAVLDKFLGPPLIWSFKTYMGLDDDTAAEGLRLYRQDYNERGGKYDAEVYEGIPKLLAALRESGVPLGVATVKPENTAKEVLEHFDLMKYFDTVSGGAPEEKKAEKKEMILRALERMDISADDSVLMIGDRVFDIEGGIAAGVKTLGVGYGFGGAAELRTAGADYIALTAADIRGLIV